MSPRTSGRGRRPQEVSPVVGTVTVVPVKCHGLPKDRMSGQERVECVMRLGGTTHRTPASDGEESVSWQPEKGGGDEYSFTVQSLSIDQLAISIRAGSNILGKGLLKLSKLQEGHILERWVPMLVQDDNGEWGNPFGKQLTAVLIRLRVVFDPDYRPGDLMYETVQSERKTSPTRSAATTNPPPPGSMGTPRDSRNNTKTLTQDELNDMVNRMYTKEMEKRAQNRKDREEAEVIPTKKIPTSTVTAMAERLHDEDLERRRKKREDIHNTYAPEAPPAQKLTPDQLAEHTHRLHTNDVRHRWLLQQRFITEMWDYDGEFGRHQPKPITMDEVEDLTKRLVDDARKSKEEKLKKITDGISQEEAAYNEQFYTKSPRARLSAIEQDESTRRLYDLCLEKRADRAEELETKYLGRESRGPVRTQEEIDSKAEALFHGRSTVDSVNVPRLRQEEWGPSGL